MNNGTIKEQTVVVAPEATKDGQLTLTRAQIAFVLKSQEEPQPEYIPKSVLAQREGWSLKLIDDLLEGCDMYHEVVQGIMSNFTP